MRMSRALVRQADIPFENLGANPPSAPGAPPRSVVFSRGMLAGDRTGPFCVSRLLSCLPCVTFGCADGVFVEGGPAKNKAGSNLI